MESRYYYFAGQTPENTKISERSHALHITSTEMNKIRKQLDRNKIAKEEREREEARKKYLEEGSKDMIKLWVDSLENIRKRKEEEKVRAIEEEKRIRHEKFLETRRELEENQKIFVEKARKQTFLKTANAQLIIRAYQSGEVLKEREKQIELKAKIKKHEDEVEAVEIENVRRIAREHAEEVKRNKDEEKRKRREWGDECRKFLAEKSQREKEEKKQRIEQEDKEWQEGKNEEACIERMKKENSLKMKRTIKADICKQMTYECEARKMAKMEDKELDECLKVFRDAKDRMQCMIKARQAEILEEDMERKVAANKYFMEKKALDALKLAEREEESYQKAAQEKDAIYREREKEIQDLKDKDAKNKIEDMQRFLKKEEQSNKDKADMLRWYKLNNLKNAEAVKMLDDERKAKQREYMKKYSQQLLQQAQDRRDNEKYEKERDEYITKTIAPNDDENFFELADEVMKNAVDKGRSTIPVHKAILEYKKNNLLPYEKQAKDDPARCEDYMEGMKGYTKNFVTKGNRLKMPFRRCKCQQDL
ncbi:unnamed protein product [Phyllotreta striolata]|uniref:Trichohyalin-plectin-homology domain-containing protein n=1 Tax=Phyllotreta striolata TaxID=444603 RepID=A0A9N9XLQ3_PHYSR|nr:unnamed protein product [Phyllotreta striolata]